MAYTFFYDVLVTAESKMWFFSAGLAMFFNGLINLIYLKLKLLLIKSMVLTANVSLMVFLIFLSFILPELQVFVLIIVMLVTTIVAALVRRPKRVNSHI
jgi:hypothetical protein